MLYTLCLLTKDATIIQVVKKFVSCFERQLGVVSNSLSCKTDQMIDHLVPGRGWQSNQGTNEHFAQGMAYAQVVPYPDNVNYVPFLGFLSACFFGAGKTLREEMA